MKIRLSFLLLVLAFCVATAVLSVRPAPADDCPDLVTYGTDPSTGECQQFATPCAVPPGWAVNYTGCAG